ncbi:MAG: AarF/UbiB family protein, partial [Sphingomonadales bacterium]
TLERVAGIPAGDRAAIVAAGVNVELTATRLVQTFLEQALFDGFFHADLHQGNLFITPEGGIVAVDFGIMGRLDQRTRHIFAEILYGFLEQDYDRVAAIHFEAGYVPPTQSREKFAQALRAIGEPIADRPLKDISLGNLMAQLLKTTETFHMETQPQLLLLQKTMVMVEGVASHLNPDVNMWEASRPVLERWIVTNLGPAARLEELRDFAASLPRRLPDFLDNIETLAAERREGGVRLHADTVTVLTRAIRHRTGWGGPLMVGFAGGVAAALLILGVFH